MVAALVMETSMSKTDANLLYKMLHTPGFNVSDLTCHNAGSLHKIVDTLVELVRNRSQPFLTVLNLSFF